MPLPRSTRPARPRQGGSAPGDPSNWRYTRVGLRFEPLQRREPRVKMSEGFSVLRDLVHGDIGLPRFVRPNALRKMGIKQVDPLCVLIPDVRDFDVSVRCRVHDLDEVVRYGTPDEISPVSQKLNRARMWLCGLIHNDIAAGLHDGRSGASVLPL